MGYELMISVFELLNAMKDAAVPVQAWRALRRLRFQDFQTVGT
jgi:hypothetical protein